MVVVGVLIMKNKILNAEKTVTDLEEQLKKAKDSLTRLSNSKIKNLQDDHKYPQTIYVLVTYVSSFLNDYNNQIVEYDFVKLLLSQKKIKYANDNLRYIELDLDENFEIVLGYKQYATKELVQVASDKFVVDATEKNY